MSFENWRILRVRDICTKVISGGTPSTRNSEYYGGSIPWLKTQEVNFNRIYETETKITDAGYKNSSANWIPANSVIMAMYGATAGKIAINKIPITTNQACCNLIINDKIADYRYIFYNLMSRYQEIASMAVGGAQQNLNAEMIRDLEVPVPPLEPQHRIAEILSALDDKIELNRQTNATLEAIAQAIFKEWFVGFNYPGATGEMVDSELGPIPKGWSVKPLDEIANFLNGLALQKYPPENGDDYLPVIKIRELRNGVTDSSDRASRKLPREYIIQDGDLLFSWSGSLEVQFWVGGEGALNQHLFKVTSENCPLWFCYHWILYHLTDFRSIAEEKTTTMGHIKREHLSNALCIIPDNIDLLDAIIQPIFSKMLLNDKESQLLSKTRELLLPELMIKRMEF